VPSGLVNIHVLTDRESVQRRISIQSNTAGRIVTSTFLNMMVIPALYLKFGEGTVRVNEGAEYAYAGEIATSSGDSEPKQELRSI
jgi:hypothetical protein